MTMDDLDRVKRALRVVRKIKCLMCERALITIQGRKETKPFQVASRVARAARWNVEIVVQNDDFTTILMNCDLGESDNLNFQVIKTWTHKLPDKIVSKASFSIQQPKPYAFERDPVSFDIGDTDAYVRAKRDLLDNLFRSALGAIA